MTDTLKKDVSVSIAVPGSTGTAPTPGTPPYCLDVTSTVPVYKTYTVTDPVTGVTTSGLYLTGTTTTTTEVCTGGSAGTPGTAGTAAVYTENFNPGWNSGAITVASLTGDGQFQFSVDAGSVGVVVGLNDVNLGDGYIEIDYGIYCYSGQYVVIENGVERTAPASFSTSDVFTIRRFGTEVAYFIGSAKVYTSAVPSSGTVFGDSSLYFGGDNIINASISPTIAATYVGESGGVTGPNPDGSNGGTLGSLLGYASNLSGGVGSYTPLGNIVGVSNSYPHGDVQNAALGNITGYSANVTTADCLGILTHLAGSASDQTNPYQGQNYCLGTLGGISGNAVTADLSLHGASCSGTLTSASGYAEVGLLAPNFSVTDAMLSPVCGFAISLVGMAAQITGTLGELHGFAPATGSSAEVDSGDPIISPVDGNGDWNGRSGGELRNLVGVAFDLSALAGGVFIGANSGGYVLNAFGQTGVIGAPDQLLGFYGVNSGNYPLSAFGGASLSETLPHPSLTASGTVTIMGEAVGILPSPELTISATVTTLGEFESETGGKYTILAYGGGVCTASLPSPELTASGLVGRLGEVVGTLPSPQLTASGTVYAINGVTGTLDSLVAPATGRLAENLPRGTLYATGTLVVTASYEAYSVTLIKDANTGKESIAATHYTNYPFQQIVRFGTKYFGVGTDGLYELTGDTFNGAPIVSIVEFAETDHGDAHIKRARSLMFGGRLSNDIALTVKTDEIKSNQFTYRMTARSGARNHRFKLGRGIEGRYFSYILTNANGLDFQIDDVSPEFDITKRDIWD